MAQKSSLLSMLYRSSNFPGDPEDLILLPPGVKRVTVKTGMTSHLVISVGEERNSEFISEHSLRGKK